MDQEMIKALTKEFSKQELEVKFDLKGNPLTYVKGHKVKERLNEAFDGEWSFEVLAGLKECLFEDYILIPGRLSYTPRVVLGNNASDTRILFGQPIVKNDVGSARIRRKDEKTDEHGNLLMKGSGDYFDLGNDYKNAVTDCLKRCAVQFGVGLYLYDGTPEEQVQPNKPATAASTNGNGHVSTSTPVSTKPSAAPATAPVKQADTNHQVNPMQVRAIENLMRTRIPKEGHENFLKTKNIASLQAITKEIAEQLIRELNTIPILKEVGAK